MKVGSLSKRVTLQSPERAPDGAGGATVTWADIATVWASIEPVSGHEPYIAQALRGKVSHKVHIRYRMGIGPKNRLLYGARSYDILAALNDKEEGRFLLLLCEEVV